MDHFRAKTAIIMAKCSVSHTEGREFESLRSCQNLGINQPFDVESRGCLFVGFVRYCRLLRFAKLGWPRTNRPTQWTSGWWMFWQLKCG